MLLLIFCFLKVYANITDFIVSVFTLVLESLIKIKNKAKNKINLNNPSNNIILTISQRQYRQIIKLNKKNEVIK